MRHALGLCFAVMLVLGAGILLWENRAHQSIGLLLFESGMTVGAMALAIPTDLAQAGQAIGDVLGKVAKYLPFLKTPTGQ